MSCCKTTGEWVRHAVGPLSHVRTTPIWAPGPNGRHRSGSHSCIFNWIKKSSRLNVVSSCSKLVVSKCESGCYQKGPLEYWRPSKMWGHPGCTGRASSERSPFCNFFFFLMFGILIDAPAVNLCNDLWYGGHLPGRPGGLTSKLCIISEKLPTD